MSAGGDNSLPNWVDPQLTDVFSKHLTRCLKGDWAFFYYSTWYLDARATCKQWHKIFEELQGTYMFLDDEMSTFGRKHLVVAENVSRFFQTSRRVRVREDTSLFPQHIATWCVSAPNLRSLDFSSGFLKTPMDVLEFANALVRFDRPLTLEDADFATDTRKVLDRTFPNLKRLVMNFRCKNGTVKFLAWVLRGSKVKDLILGREWSSDPTYHVVLSCLQHLPFLRSLDTGLASRGKPAHWDILTQLCVDTLRDIKLRLDPEDYMDQEKIATQIIAWLQKLPALRSIESELFLDLNVALPTYAAKNLTLPTTFGLKRLWLRSTWIGNAGAAVIAKFLRSGQSKLYQLGLLECELEHEGLVAIVTALAEDKTMFAVDLSYNRTKEKTAFRNVVANTLKQNSTLKHLYLKYLFEFDDESFFSSKGCQVYFTRAFTDYLNKRYL